MNFTLFCSDSIESAIEMTGYGILTLVKLGGPHFLAAASDALRWIIQYQNQNGGFVSSQVFILYYLSILFILYVTPPCIINVKYVALKLVQNEAV